VADLLFPHAKQVLRITRRRRAPGTRKWSKEIVYAVTDLTFHQATAAELAAELGPSARELVPRLEKALADPVSAPAATRALHALDPEGAWSADRGREAPDAC